MQIGLYSTAFEGCKKKYLHELKITRRRVSSMLMNDKRLMMDPIGMVKNQPSTYSKERPQIENQTSATYVVEAKYSWMSITSVN